MEKRSKVGFWWHFDRIFGDNRNVWLQVAMIVALVVVLVFGIGMVGWWLQDVQRLPKGDDHSSWVQAVGLAFGASDLPTGDNESQAFPLWWQAIAMLLGSVLFSGVTITFVSNLLGNRQEAYRNGSVRYPFKGHVLLLGGGEMALSVLRREQFDGYHVVVATQDDVRLERLRIESLLGRDRCRRITVLHAYRDNRCELESLRLKDAKMVFIVGEQPDEVRFDQLNAACWHEAKNICVEAQREVPCVLVLEHEETERLFYSSNQLHGELDTLVISRLESASQIMFNEEVPLDRDGIGPDSERTVHLVLYGMTPFARAVATTAAQLCHFPNFVGVSRRDGRVVYSERPERRTRITFIAPNMERERDAFMSSYDKLFRLSRVTIDGTVHTPEEDFLDVEWEFVDGHIASPRIQQLLEEYYKADRDGHTYLTLALCETPQVVYDNYRMATRHLPACYGQALDDGTKVPVFIYQPEGEELVRMGAEATSVNIVTAGSAKENYNAALLRSMREGMMVNYIYVTGLSPDMDIQSPEVVRIWKEMHVTRAHSDMLSSSNIHCANHIHVKLRSLGGDGERLRTEEGLSDLMAVVEHNRWNMEKLLAGYGPVSKKDREELARLDQTDAVAYNALAKKLKDNFCHPCIVPYEQLRERDKEYDRTIVKYLPEVVKYSK